MERRPRPAQSAFARSRSPRRSRRRSRSARSCCSREAGDDPRGDARDEREDHVRGQCASLLRDLSGELAALVATPDAGARRSARDPVGRERAAAGPARRDGLRAAAVPCAQGARAGTGARDDPGARTCWIVPSVRSREMGLGANAPVPDRMRAGRTSTCGGSSSSTAVASSTRLSPSDPAARWRRRACDVRPQQLPADAEVTAQAAAGVCRSRIASMSAPGGSVP